MNKTIENYLKDTLALLIERAKEAKEVSAAKRRSEPNSHSAIFEEGRALAYYEILSTIFGQAETFGIQLKELGITDFNPDRDLLQK